MPIGVALGVGGCHMTAIWPCSGSLARRPVWPVV